MTQVTKERTFSAITRGMPTSDGAGVRMVRLIGTPQLDHVDPFLLFDVFRSDNPDDYIAGFPAHPHRGFETVTYMFAGNMRHKDNAGHEGVIRSGGVQWMTAGRGIVHSEMPEQKDGLMWGTQLWINLPAGDKMCPPAYAEYDDDAIPREERGQGIVVKVVAGTTSQGTPGVVQGRPTNPLYLDIRLPPGAQFEEPLPATHSAILFVVEGAVSSPASKGDSILEAGTLAGMAAGIGAITLQGSDSESRVLLIAAREIREPIARGGPFVMNSEEELYRAFADYQAGRF